jgi:hypothetical protein
VEEVASFEEIQDARNYLFEVRATRAAAGRTSAIAVPLQAQRPEAWQRSWAQGRRGRAGLTGRSRGMVQGCSPTCAAGTPAPPARAV